MGSAIGQPSSKKGTNFPPCEPARLDHLFIRKLRDEFQTNEFHLNDAERIAAQIGYPHDVGSFLDDIAIGTGDATSRMPARAQVELAGEHIPTAAGPKSTRGPLPPSSMTAKPAPFLKWAGGKGRLLNLLLAQIPSAFGRYFEPFVGGGALLFQLAPKNAVIADANEALVRTYRGVRDDVGAVIQALASCGNDESSYYQARSTNVEHLGDRRQLHRPV